MTTVREKIEEAFPAGVYCVGKCEPCTGCYCDEAARIGAEFGYRLAIKELRDGQGWDFVANLLESKLEEK